MRYSASEKCDIIRLIEQSSSVLESTVYRILKAHDLITSPTYTLMQATEKFQHPTTHINKMWQTDLTYCKIIGWGLRYAQTYQFFTEEALLGLDQFSER